MGGPYLLNDTALKGFDPTPYNVTIAAPATPSGPHGASAFSAGDPGTGQDPLVSWNGVIDVINNRLTRDYKVTFNSPAAGGFGDPVSRTSDAGNLIGTFVSGLLPHVAADHVITKQDILNARDKIRQYGMYQRFAPLDRRLTKQTIEDLLKLVPLYYTSHGSSGAGGTFGGDSDNTFYDETSLMFGINSYLMERISDGAQMYFWSATIGPRPDNPTIMPGTYPFDATVEDVINRWAKEDMFADDKSTPVVRWKFLE